MTINNPQPNTNSHTQPYSQNFKLQPYFNTEDIALASWLYMNGIKLLAVDNSIFPTKFTFEANNNKIDPLITVFQTGTANGNVCTFYRSYKILLKQIKTVMNNNGRQR